PPSPGAPRSCRSRTRKARSTPTTSTRSASAADAPATRCSRTWPSARSSPRCTTRPPSTSRKPRGRGATAPATSRTPNASRARSCACRSTRSCRRARSRTWPRACWNWPESKSFRSDGLGPRADKALPVSAPESASPEPLRWPVLGLAESVLFPHDVCSLEFTDAENLRALARLNALDGLVVAAPLRAETGAEAPVTSERFHPIGTLARVVSRVSLGGAGLRIALQGLRRVHLGQLTSAEGCSWSSAERVEERAAPAEQRTSQRAHLAGLLAALAETDESISREFTGLIGRYGEDDGRL